MGGARRYEGRGARRPQHPVHSDLEVFDPFLQSLPYRDPGLTLDYTVVSSTELQRAILEGAAFDVALSSAIVTSSVPARERRFSAQSYQSSTTGPPARLGAMIFSSLARPDLRLHGSELGGGGHLTLSASPDCPFPRPGMDSYAVLARQSGPTSRARSAPTTSRQRPRLLSSPPQDSAWPRTPIRAWLPEVMGQRSRSRLYCLFGFGR